MSVSVEFIEGLHEEISQISLRQGRDSQRKTVVLVFEKLQALEKLRAYTNRISNLWLRDDEGNIQVTPSGIKFFSFEEDEISKVECSFELENAQQFDRVMRFFHRYAEAYGFNFESKAVNPA
jgi:photosystem II Psb28-2 protein